VTTLNLQVDADNDDARELDDGTNFTASSTTLPIYSNVLPNSRWHMGCRFTGVTIAQAATIDSATFQGYVVDAGFDDPNLDLYCHDVDNTDDFAATADVKTRHDSERTTAGETLTATGVGTGWYSFPSMVSPVQEVIDRGGWSSGNALMVLARGKSDSDTLFYIRAHDGNKAQAAKLDIDYTAAAAGSLVIPRRLNTLLRM